jgi:hypothetical protein
MAITDLGHVRVAVIGSFRRHYDLVLDAMEVFETAGCEVTSPARSRIVDHRDEFVRFETDPPFSLNEEIELQALLRILTSDLVYVVAPEGYVGKTTCYEIGAVEIMQIPTFFSERPVDLPLAVSKHAILDPASLVNLLRAYRPGSSIEDTDLKPEVRTVRAELRKLANPQVRECL